MSSKFKLQFSVENAAFGETQAERDAEIARILRQVAARIEAGETFHHYRNILDTNGNIVGVFAVKDE